MGGPSSKTLNMPAKRKQSYRNYEPNMLVFYFNNLVYILQAEEQLLTHGRTEGEPNHSLDYKQFYNLQILKLHYALK